jgi:hypothetical protein
MPGVRDGLEVVGFAQNVDEVERLRASGTRRRRAAPVRPASPGPR